MQSGIEKKIIDVYQIAAPRLYTTQYERKNFYKKSTSFLVLFYLIGFDVGEIFLVEFPKNLMTEYVKSARSNLLIYLL